jgi:hypothetical protein
MRKLSSQRLAVLIEADNLEASARQIFGALIERFIA